jgi:hypothetical protein
MWRQLEEDRITVFGNDGPQAEPIFWKVSIFEIEDRGCLEIKSQISCGEISSFARPLQTFSPSHPMLLGKISSQRKDLSMVTTMKIENLPL